MLDLYIPMKSFLLTVEKFFGVYRWHPKIALRYLPIVAEIRRSKIKNPKILEIGSGSIGIAPYYKRKVTGLDLEFPLPHFDMLKQVKGNALHMPFPDKSFDFVLSVDMLEHVAAKDREKAVYEAVRVTKGELIIAVPCGKRSQAHDKELSKRYEETMGKKFDFLKEHIQLGLPTKKEIKDLITLGAKKNKRIYILQTKGLLNLSVRNFLMHGWMTESIFFDVIFRKLFLIFIPILRLCNFEPTYRRMFFVQFRDDD